MQRIGVGDLLIGIEMEPASTTLILGPGVPSQDEALRTAARKRNQVLLQRIDAERVSNLEIPERAVRPVGANDELAILRGLLHGVCVI